MSTIRKLHQEVAKYNNMLSALLYYVADSDVRINYTVHGKDSSGDFT